MAFRGFGKVPEGFRARGFQRVSWVFQGIFEMFHGFSRNFKRITLISKGYNILSNPLSTPFFLHSSKLLAQIEREETHLLLLRVMVGLVILYDHVHPVGAFARGAHVDVKGCVRLLQAQPAIKAEPLLNALRYTTKHLNEDNTPKNIRNLLAA